MDPSLTMRASVGSRTSTLKLLVLDLRPVVKGRSGCSDRAKIKAVGGEQSLKEWRCNDMNTHGLPTNYTRPNSIFGFLDDAVEEVKRKWI